MRWSDDFWPGTGTGLLAVIGRITIALVLVRFTHARRASTSTIFRDLRDRGDAWFWVVRSRLLHDPVTGRVAPVS